MRTEIRLERVSWHRAVLDSWTSKAALIQPRLLTPAASLRRETNSTSVLYFPFRRTTHCKAFGQTLRILLAPFQRLPDDFVFVRAFCRLSGVVFCHTSRGWSAFLTTSDQSTANLQPRYDSRSTSGIHKRYCNLSRTVWENAGKTNETLAEIFLWLYVQLKLIIARSAWRMPWIPRIRRKKDRCPRWYEATHALRLRWPANTIRWANHSAKLWKSLSVRNVNRPTVSGQERPPIGWRASATSFEILVCQRTCETRSGDNLCSRVV